MISTSEIKISVLIKKNSAKKALAALEDDGFVISRFNATPAPSNKPAKPEKKTPQEKKDKKEPKKPVQ